MRTALLYKILVAFLLVPTLVIANTKDGWKGKHTKEKKLNKEYTVNSDATVEIDNSYGNIDVITWNENRVVIEVTITTNGNDEEKVQRKLDGIDVDFSGSSNKVSAKTRFQRNKSWWNWGKNNVNMKINYVVKMPVTNHVNLDNNYGSINLDKIEGRAYIDCDYGKITTKELMADNNVLSFDYTKNSYFEYIKSGTISADYSGYTVGKSNDLTIDADYTKSKIEMAEDIKYDCDYGSLTIDNVNNVNGDGDYLSTRLGNVYKSVSITADYGSCKIANMTKNAGSIDIESDYMKITIGYDPAYNFDFDIDLSYASLRDTEGLEFTKKNVRSSSKTYQGYNGTQGSGNSIKINSTYGSVSLKRN